MKTEKLKYNHTKLEGLEWLVKCHKHQDKYGAGSMVFSGSTSIHPYVFSHLPEEYEIVRKPEYIPYSKDTLDELEEKAMRMMVHYKYRDLRFTVTEIGVNGVRVGYDRSTKEMTHALNVMLWSDGSAFGTEAK